MSTLVFANPAGLWALLGIPVVLAIHFLQPRAQRRVITTLFLLEHLPPLATTGRAWRWLRSSWALWLQLLAVLLLSWVLAEPRWQRTDSVQTIAVLLDASASMQPFRENAVQELRARAPEWERAAARTEWIVRETDIERPVLYRGFERAQAIAALERWRPDLGSHDFQPAWEVARRLVRRNGASVFITDRRPSQTLEGIALLAVGRALENVGFASGSITLVPGSRPRWTVLVQHHGAQAAQRQLDIIAGTEPSRANGAPTLQSEALTLAPGELMTLSGEFPAGVDALWFRLSSDEFELDDALPLVVPVPRALTWRAVGPERGTAFFQKFLERTPGLTRALAGAKPDVAIFATSTPFSQPLSAAALLEIVIYTTEATPGRLATAPIVADRHPWIDDLSWSGLLGPGPAAEMLPAGARGLLWQNERPLAWAETIQGVPRLLLGWDWPASNAERLPASAVLLHRVIEDARFRKLAPETTNFSTGQLITLAPTAFATDDEWTLRFGDERRTISAADAAALRAPTRPGFFEVRRGEEIIVRGAAQFSDPREASFLAAQRIAEPETLPLDVLEANSERDHLRPLWLLLLAAVLLASWAAQAPRRRMAEVPA